MDSSIPNVGNIFKEACNELMDSFDCTYVSYLYQYKNFKLSLVTHSDWMDLYINQSLINNCSLIRVGLDKIALSKTSNVILRWNDVLPISKEEKNTNGLRTEFNICNGISFGRNIFGASDYFGMASDRKNYEFSRNVIINSVRVRQLMDKLFFASAITLFYDVILKNLGYSFPINTLALIKA